MSESTNYGPHDDLSHAPEAVKRASAHGCGEIFYFPSGFTTTDPCGSCFTKHKPGWYEKSSCLRNENLQTTSMLIICDLDGKLTNSSIDSGDFIADCC
jgi:hypothetical protein